MRKTEQLSIPTEDNNEKRTIRTCAFTGHRELGNDVSLAKIKKETEKLVLRGAEIFYNGMAMGFDLLAAEAVLSLKRKYPHIRLVACVPFYGQESRFSPLDKKRYATMLKQADETLLLSEYYYRGCLQYRDRYMADRADVLVAYCKKTTGGAAYTLAYFKKKFPHGEVLAIAGK